MTTLTGIFKTLFRISPGTLTILRSCRHVLIPSQQIQGDQAILNFLSAFRFILHHHPIILRRIVELLTAFYVHGSVHRESVSIIVQRDATIYSFIIFLQTSLHVSDDTLTHHQEHTQNRNCNIWHWSNRVCYCPLTWRSRNDSPTSADGSKHCSTSARCCNYGFECAPDDGWGYHPKHVEMSAEI